MAAIAQPNDVELAGVSPGRLRHHRTPSLVARAKTVEETRHSGRKWLFTAICVLELLVNFDNGSLPASLDALSRTYGLSFSELGILGALVYLGLVLSCPVTGWLLTQFQGRERWILLGSVAVNAAAVLCMGVAPNVEVLMVARAAVGFAQAPVIIFAPVWVDEFAPSKSMTLWISLLQANVAIGIMLGYLCAGLLTAYLGPEAWRIAFYLQGGCLAAFVFLFVFISDQDVGAVGGLQERLLRIERELLEADAQMPLTMAVVPEDGDRDDEASISSSSSSSSEDSSDRRRGANQTHQTQQTQTQLDDYDYEEDELPVGTGLCRVLQSRRFLFLTLSLSGLYFVVTGIQFFITLYMVRDLGVDEAIVVALFAAVSLTGPTAGVFFGGWLIDRMGGYRESTDPTAVSPVAVTLRTCAGFGIGAVVFAMPAAFISNAWIVMACIWLVLFFGGALVPAMTGVVMTAVDPSVRALSNSVSMLAYNILGYAAAPVVCGVIASETTLQWGFRSVLLVSVLAVVPIILAAVHAEWYPTTVPTKDTDLVQQQQPQEEIPSTEQPQHPETQVRKRLSSNLSAPRRSSAFRPDRMPDFAALRVNRPRTGSSASKPRRKSSLLHSIGDISGHVSRGRTLTSFYLHNSDLPTIEDTN